jgi:hypothetical protein
MKSIPMRMLLMQVIMLCMFTTTTMVLFAQHDSLVLKKGDVIVGEMKSLNKGVLTIETDYSKSDFTIEWSGIKEIFSKTRFLITLKNGDRINGIFRSADSGKIIFISDPEGKETQTTLDDIVYLKGLKSAFWSRVHANIDLGLSITKANNLKQYNMRSAVGYLADKWLVDIYYNDTRSSQDSVEDTKRTESGASFTYFLPRDWYTVASISTLSNTEQALKLRFTGKLGVGKYLVHTNASYWGLGAGLSYNNEQFSNKTTSRSSLEGYIGSEVNLFDIGDFSLLSNLYVYPSFTESGRWRADYMLDTKYEFPLDFYLKFGITINYDNQPAVPGNETDYVYVFSIGWKL